MTSYSESNSPTFQHFFRPAHEAYANSERQYNCTSLPDMDFLEMGILRCLSESQTGRDFLQRHGDHGRKDVEISLHFKALQSGRRLENITSIGPRLSATMANTMEDPWLSIPELNDFAFYAGDGHYHVGAVHDQKRSGSGGELRKLPVGHFFMLNLRTHYLCHLASADTSGSRKGEHDMHAIKRSEITALRGSEPKGKKVILVWDKAGIDFAFWHRVKNSSGLYFISREKENMKLIPRGSRLFDKSDARNAGVVSDEQVGPGGGSGAMLRRIVYINPVDRKVYRYITTEMKLPPGIIALLYKQRWDIEKVFDELKTKLKESKAWASSLEAKMAQAQFLCLTHNLMMLLEEEIQTREEVENETEKQRKRGRKEEAIKDGANYIATVIQRFTVRSLKFIRWLRNFVYREASWSESVARLREIYATF